MKSNVDGSGGDAVLVAVRVRPFNERERQRQVKLVVHMPDDQLTVVSDLSDAPPKTFNFDHSYWSHDGFESDENGYFTAREGRRYADQRKVFNDLGLEVLENAWKGYNCSLFAYGQTGSGKSYSIVGFNKNKGIIPQMCEELFRRIGELRETDDSVECLVTISMMEIYCEKVRDLLSVKPTPRGGLKVREHPKSGFYVEGLSNFVVHSYREIERKVLEGTQNRTIAATNMNETSSRAHTIVKLGFLQKQTNSGTNGMTKSSEINLVDLAGSERQKSSQSEGDRLKEGIIINKSLSVLGRVIKTLHENQQLLLQQQHGGFGRTRATQVPYRDSVLTSLLRNALGGNSKTIMLATISPSDSCRDETLSTLRFADRVKSIRTKPVINESATERMLRELREENTRLQEMIRRGDAAIHETSTQEELENLKRQLSENQKEMANLEKNWQLKLAEETRKRAGSNASLNSIDESAAAKKSSKDDGRRTSADDFLDRRRREKPHLWNLNEDPALTDVIVHFIEPGDNRIGSGAGDISVQIVLKGLSILPEHALLVNKDNKRVTLCPLNGADVLVNGKTVTSDVELQQNDRIHFGGNHLYVFVNPTRQNIRPDAEISYEMAQREIAKNLGTIKFRANLPGRGEFNNISVNSPASSSNYSKEDAVLEEDLVNILPNVYRANAMAKELSRNVHFEIILLPPEMRALNSGSTEIWIKLHDMDEDTTFLWDQNRFMSRYFGMQEMYRSFMDGDADWNLPKERDPFHEPADAPIIVGTVRVFLQSLAYMVELDEQFPIVDIHGSESGELCVSLTPCNATGKEILGEFVENPLELVNKNLAFKVKVLSALGLPRRIDHSFCTYSFFDRGETRTNHATGSNPAYAHEQLFTFRPVTKELVEYLMNGSMNVIVSGIQKSKDTTLHSEATAARISGYLSSDGDRHLSDKKPIGGSNTLGSTPTLLRMPLDSHYKNSTTVVASPILKNAPSKMTDKLSDNIDIQNSQKFVKTSAIPRPKSKVRIVKGEIHRDSGARTSDLSQNDISRKSVDPKSTTASNQTTATAANGVDANLRKSRGRKKKSATRSNSASKTRAISAASATPSARLKANVEAARLKAEGTSATRVKKKASSSKKTS